MQIRDNILQCLQAVTGLQTVFDESPAGTNLRIDRKQTPAAVLYTLKGFAIDTSTGVRKDTVDAEVFIFDRCDISAKGEAITAKLETLEPMVDEFVSGIMDVKGWNVENDRIEVRTAVGAFDTNVVGFSLEFKVTERQGRCIEYVPPVPVQDESLQTVHGSNVVPSESLQRTSL